MPRRVLLSRGVHLPHSEPLSGWDRVPRSVFQGGDLSCWAVQFRWLQIVHHLRRWSVRGCFWPAHGCMQWAVPRWDVWFTCWPLVFGVQWILSCRLRVPGGIHRPHRVSSRSVQPGLCGIVHPVPTRAVRDLGESNFAGV
jgi:hypothetical protein